MSISPERQKLYNEELAALRHLLDTVEVVGFPKETAEIAELKRLQKKYPTQARNIASNLENE